VSFLSNHLLLMLIYAILTGAFFALLSTRDRRGRWRLFALVAGILLVGGLSVAWIMYPFPLR